MREKNISDWPNNNAVIAGCVVDTPMYEFSVGNKSYYRVTISARRLSGTEDLVPCYIEDSKVAYIHKYDYVEIIGHIRTKHVVDSVGVNHTKVYIEVHEVNPYTCDKNKVDFIAYKFADIEIRATPRGYRVCDTRVINNLPNRIGNLIPILLWSINAELFARIPLNSIVGITGRFQSREYNKFYEDGTEEKKTAYEISVSRFKVLEERKEKKDGN